MAEDVMSAVERHALTPSGQLTLNDLSEVRGALFDARHRWFDIGIELKLPVGTLYTVREQFLHAADCLREMCIEWLKRIDPRPSWATLVKVLESPPVGEGHLAQQLRDKYCPGKEGILAKICFTMGPSLPGTPTSQGPPNLPITGPPGIPPPPQSASTFERNPSNRQSMSEPIPHPPKVPKFPGFRLTDKSQSVLSDHLRANILELRQEYQFRSIVSAAPPVKVKFDFRPPSFEDGFLERVFKDNVSLQRAYFDPLRLSIVGDTRVTNFFYEKKVSAVCTWNNWDKEFEVRAEFNGTHVATDIFTFELPICCSHYSTMQFAIRYITGGQVFWDNNQGKNYMVRINFPTLAASDTTIKEESVTPKGDECT